MQGRCTCGAVRIRLLDRPMFVNCCHCSWCQRETGSAFAINAVIERQQIEVSGTTEMIECPSASGIGQSIARCPNCQVALWSHYGGAARSIAFLRVGIMDDPGDFPPEAHIFTSTKLPWLLLDGKVPVFSGYYDMRGVWPAKSLARRSAIGA